MLLISALAKNYCTKAHTL